MQNKKNKIKPIGEKIFINIFCVLSILMFYTLLFHGLCLTGVHKAEGEHIYLRSDSVICNSFLLFFAIVMFCLIGKIYDKFIVNINKNIIFVTVCLISLAISLFWVTFVKAAPQGDQGMVCGYANAFNTGDFGGFKKGMYLSSNSWQLGMVSFLRIIFNIFGYDNWRAFQYISACMVPLIVFAGCKITRLLTDNNGKIEFYYLLFSVTCVPMYVYTLFVYGEIISTALALMAAWLMLSCINKFSWKKALAMGILLGVAVQLRKNVLIIVVAFMIVIILKLLCKWNWKTLVIGICIVGGVGLIHTVHWGWYADKIDPEAQSIPASLYIIMGLNDDYGRPGWYNNYNYHVFAISDYDVETANAKAREDFNVYINLYRNDPDYFVEFFIRKMNAQWNVPMYQCFKMNDNFYEEISPFIADIYNGQGIGYALNSGMKMYQLVLYASVFVFVIISLNTKKNIEQYTLLIAVFGGFLFSLIWEAKPRYVFPYLLLMLPYGAIGINTILNKMEKWFKH